MELENGALTVYLFWKVFLSSLSCLKVWFHIHSKSLTVMVRGCLHFHSAGRPRSCPQVLGPAAWCRTSAQQHSHLGPLHYLEGKAFTVVFILQTVSESSLTETLWNNKSSFFSFGAFLCLPFKKQFGGILHYIMQPGQWERGRKWVGR